MRYRKKPVIIDAVQWTGDNPGEMEVFAGSRFAEVAPEDRTEDPEVTAEVLDSTHSTWVGIYTGDWIIRGVQGELCPCDGAVFQAAYEPVSCWCGMPDGDHDGAAHDARTSDSPLVALAQLYGTMMDLAEGMPMWTHDLQQAAEMDARDLPEQESGAHDALADARHVMHCLRHLGVARADAPTDRERTA